MKNRLIKILKQYSLLEWLLLGVLIGDNGWWFIWGTPSLSGVFWMANAIVIIILMRKHILCSRNIRAVFLFFLFFVIYQSLFHSEFHISSVIISFLFLVGCQLSPKHGARTLELVTHYVAITIILSLPAWLIHQFVMPLQMVSQIDIGIMKTGVSGSVLMENYGLFVTPTQGIDIFRFYGPFDEPGVLGTLSALILWANKYDFRNPENVVIVIGAVFTFSLAFYILFALGLFFNSGMSLKRLFIIAVFLCIISLVLCYLFRDHEGFHTIVINRFLNYEDYGTESRTNYAVNAFWDKYIFSINSFCGKGSGFMTSNFGGGGSSYKNFIIEYGILGFVIIVCSYLSMAPKSGRFEYMTLILYILSFLQRPLLLSGYEVIMFCITIKANQYYRLKDCC